MKLYKSVLKVNFSFLIMGNYLLILITLSIIE
jgi:hypothetical protein